MQNDKLIVCGSTTTGADDQKWAGTDVWWWFLVLVAFVAGASCCLFHGLFVCPAQPAIPTEREQRDVVMWPKGASLTTTFNNNKNSNNRESWREFS